MLFLPFTCDDIPVYAVFHPTRLVFSICTVSRLLIGPSLLDKGFQSNSMLGVKWTENPWLAKMHTKAQEYGIPNSLEKTPIYYHKSREIRK